MSAIPQERISGGINADDEYWEALGRGEFALPVCTGCKKVVWPANVRCGDCGSWDFDWTARAAAGEVYSWTRTWYPFDRTRERAEDIPYVTVLVEVDGGEGARVIGMLNGSDEKLRIGARVQGVILPPSEKSKNYPTITWTLD